MAGKLAGKTIAFLATEGVEQVELTDPWKAVQDAGGTAELISLEAGHVQAFNHLDKADTFPVDHTAGEADPARYDALVLPGGVANPDQLRTDEDAVAFANWVDEQVHVDEGLVSSRKPDDLPAFCEKLVEEFCEGRHEGRRQRAGSAA